MKESVSFSRFCDSFKGDVGADRDNSFSYEGKKALFNYLENYEEETGEEIELDPISLCCEYTEYEDIAEFNEAYSKDATCLEDIEEYTTVIDIGQNKGDKGFIIQQF